MKWDDLRTFLAVAEAGTLAKAASLLGVNASTVHRRVAALEASVGGALFERDPRGYALTAMGEALVPAAVEVEEAVLGFSRAATGHDRTAQGPVRLTLPETLLVVVAPALVRVREACPGLRPVVLAESRLLAVGREAEVALRPSNAPPEEAVGRKVGRLGWAVYGPLHTHDKVPWCIYGEGGGPAAARWWWQQHHGHDPVLLEVSSVGAMHRVLGCTRAQGLLPCYLGDPDTRLARRSEVLPEVSVDLWLLLHADLRKSARVRALVDLLEPELRAAEDLLAGQRR